MVPLRFVNLTGTCPGTQCADWITHEGILDSVTKANQVFKGAGIQFYVRSVERYQAPTFKDPTVAGNVTWPAAYAELGPVFPNMPCDAWAANISWGRQTWMSAISAVYAPHNEIHVWVTKTGHGAHFPWRGRTIRMAGADMDARPYIFSHELGHYFGLKHTFDVPGGTLDPETLQPLKKADFWDLVYKPGTSGVNPHVYYNDFATAWGTNGANEPNLKRIHKRPCVVHCPGSCRCISDPKKKCGVDCGCGPTECESSDGTCCRCGCGTTECDSCIDLNPAGALACHIGESSAYAESHSNGGSAVKGLAVYLGGQKHAVNVLTYSGDFTTHPYFLSDSQVLVLRKYLRWDVPIDQSVIDNTLFGANPSPSCPGTSVDAAFVPSGRRAALGSFSYPDPQRKLDFNNDGKRDLAVWIPPTVAGSAGRLKVLLSPTFSTAPSAMIDTDFGRIGDIPIVADFDTDGRSDFGVVQPGGGPNRTDATDNWSYWRWCITNTTPTATSCGGISQTTCPAGNCLAFGLRGHTPTPGLELDGALPNEIARYAPESAVWFWRNLSGTVNTSRSLGAPNSGSIPLPGQYDGDFLDDLVLYQPVAASPATAATYYYRRSEQSYNTVGWFAMPVPPSPTGDATQRTHAFPVPMFVPYLACDPVEGCSTQKRQVFSVFHAYAGTWNTGWFPFVSSQVQQCAYGADRADQPFTGFDRDGDKLSDMGIYRDKAFGGSATIFTRRSSVSACNGADVNQSCSTCGVRSRVFAVRDMTGDGKEELILLHPDIMIIEWRTSESSYATTGGLWNLLNPLAIFL